MLQGAEFRSGGRYGGCVFYGFFARFRPIMKPRIRCSDLVIVGFWPVSEGFLRLPLALEHEF